MITVQAAGACDNAAAYVDYDVLAQGPVATITFINPAGDDVRVNHAPLRGRAMWPGIVVRHDGTVVDWPGWRKERGVWVEGDEFDWAVNQVVVEFDAGAVIDILVDYPDPTDDCIPTPEGGVDGRAIIPTPSPNGSTASTIDPPETSTFELMPATPDGRQRILITLFAATMAAAMFGISRLRTVQVPERSVHIETAQEFTSRVATMRRTRPAPRSSAPVRSRARRA